MRRSIGLRAVAATGGGRLSQLCSRPGPAIWVSPEYFPGSENSDPAASPFGAKVDMHSLFTGASREALPALRFSLAAEALPPAGVCLSWPAICSFTAACGLPDGFWGGPSSAGGLPPQLLDALLLPTNVIDAGRSVSLLAWGCRLEEASEPLDCPRSDPPWDVWHHGNAGGAVAVLRGLCRCSACHWRYPASTRHLSLAFWSGARTVGSCSWLRSHSRAPTSDSCFGMRQCRTPWAASLASSRSFLYISSQWTRCASFTLKSRNPSRANRSSIFRLVGASDPVAFTRPCPAAKRSLCTCSQAPSFPPSGQQGTLQCRPAPPWQKGQLQILSLSLGKCRGVQPTRVGQRTHVGVILPFQQLLEHGIPRRHRILEPRAVRLEHPQCRPPRSSDRAPSLHALARIYDIHDVSGDSRSAAWLHRLRRRPRKSEGGLPSLLSSRKISHASRWRRFEISCSPDTRAARAANREGKAGGTELARGRGSFDRCLPPMDLRESAISRNPLAPG